MTEINSAGYGQPKQVVYENDSYRVETGYPPHSPGDFVYLTYMVVNKSNGIVENFNNILYYALRAADDMAILGKMEEKTAEITTPQTGFSFN